MGGIRVPQKSARPRFGWNGIMLEPHDDHDVEATPADGRSTADGPMPGMPSASGEPPAGQPASAVHREADQFTLGELCGLVAALAVLLSLISSAAHWMAIGKAPADLAAVYATVFGVAALVSMIVLAWLPQPRRIVTVGWWALLSLYIIAAAVAVWMSK